MDVRVDELRPPLGNHGCDNRSADSEWHNQHYRERDAPALIEGGKAQEHDDEGDGVQERSLIARLLLLERGAGPLNLIAVRELLGEADDLIHCLTGGVSGLRLSGDLDCREGVEALETRRAVGPFLGGEGAERNHLAAGVGNVPLVEVKLS